MSGADRLREAARVLRENANEATAGPWRDEFSGITGPVVVDDEAQDARDCIATCGHLRARNDARYIATMHPGVGLALADLLERLAHDIAALDEHQPRPEWIGFALANLILGGTQ